MSYTLFLVTLEWRRMAELAEACDTPVIACWWLRFPTVSA